MIRGIVMKARRSLILVLAAILALTMCSFSVFAEDEEVLATVTATAPDTAEAPDGAIANEALDLAVSSEEEPVAIVPDGTVPENDELPANEADVIADGAGEIEKAELATDDAAPADGEEAPAEDAEAEEKTENKNEKKRFVGSAGFWILVVLGALILLFLILWIVKPSFREKIKKLIREYKSELKKIVWSSKEDVIKNTKTVVVAIVVTAVVIGLIDLGLGKLIDLVGKIG